MTQGEIERRPALGVRLADYQHEAKGLIGYQRSGVLLGPHADLICAKPLRKPLGPLPVDQRRFHAAILLLSLAACKTTSSAESRATATSEVRTDAASHETVTATVQTGPETITTTVEEFSTTPTPAPDGDLGLGTPSGSAKPPVSAPPRPAPVLVKRTVVVDQRGPAVSTTTEQAQLVIDRHGITTTAQEAHTASESKPAAGCALGLGFYAALALVAAGALAWVFRRALFPWWPK